MKSLGVVFFALSLASVQAVAEETMVEKTETVVEESSYRDPKTQETTDEVVERTKGKIKSEKGMIETVETVRTKEKYSKSGKPISTEKQETYTEKLNHN